MKAKDLLVEMYDFASDNVGVANPKAERRPRLTLLQIQKLRKSRDVRRVSDETHKAFLTDIYGAVPADQQGGI